MAGGGLAADRRLLAGRHAEDARDHLFRGLHARRRVDPRRLAGGFLLRLAGSFGAGQFFHHLFRIGAGGLGALGGLAGRLALLLESLLLPAAFGALQTRVETAAFLGVFEDVVGMADFGETVVCRGIILILVGMGRFRLGSPGCLDLVWSGVTLDAQHGIGIAHL